VGEEGVDEGGVQKEFFQLLVGGWWGWLLLLPLLHLASGMPTVATDQPRYATHRAQQNWLVLQSNPTRRSSCYPRPPGAEPKRGVVRASLGL
jgi:hypothetical protein